MTKIRVDLKRSRRGFKCKIRKNPMKIREIRTPINPTPFL